MPAAAMNDDDNDVVSSDDSRQQEEEEDLLSAEDDEAGEEEEGEEVEEEEDILEDDDEEEVEIDDDDEEDGSSVSSASPSDTDRARLLEIVVKRVGKGDGNVLCLQVDPSASVLDLKTQISQELAEKDHDDLIPVDRQRLVYFGRMLRDNEEVLGHDIKMKPEVTNYVHLSPLPEGAKPSARSGSINSGGAHHHHHHHHMRSTAAAAHISPAAFSFTARSSSSAPHHHEIGLLSSAAESESSRQQSMERARRLGVSSRERRRRRQDRPYSEEAIRTASSASSSGPATSGGDPVPPTSVGAGGQGSVYAHLEEAFAAAVPLGVGSAVSGATAVGSRLHHHPSGIFPFTTSSARRGYLSGPSLLSTLTLPTTSGTTSQTSNSQLAQLSHLTSTVAAVSAEAQAVRSIADSHRYMLQQAQGLSFELAPFLSVLEERLRQAGNDGNFSSPTGLEHTTPDAQDTIHLLDHVSREASTLALLLRRVPPDAHGLSSSAALGRTSSSSSLPPLSGALPPTTAAVAAPLSAMPGAISVEQVVSSGDPAILIPQGPSIFLPSGAGGWFPSMM